jgi:hypothetical protein
MSWFIDQELASSIHFRKLVIGYSSKTSNELSQTVFLWSSMLADPSRQPAFFDYLTSLGVTNIILNRDLLPEAIYQSIQAELISRGAKKMLFRREQKEAWNLGVHESKQ